MKRIFNIAAAALMMAACSQQNIVTPVDFAVTLDPDNVYRPGQPVHFRFEGDADYIVFYSGEQGHEFRYRDRTSVPLESIRSAVLDLETTRLWGKPVNGMDMYLSSTFPGLNTANGEADRRTMREILDGGMEGWENLNYDDSKAMHNVPVEARYDIMDYAEQFCIAFHWHPQSFNFTASQSTYFVNGNISVVCDDGLQMNTDFNDVQFDLIVMNEEDEPYLGVDPKQRINPATQQPTSIGTIHFNDRTHGCAINFEGTSQSFLTYEIDAWCISRPISLNSVLKDKGVQIKTMMNPVFDFSYTWNAPGTYKVVFHGVNDNYQGRTEAVQEVTVIIADDPVFD